MEKEKIHPGQPIAEGENDSSLPRIRVISEWPGCRNILQLQSFLGLCNYYRCFVQQFKHITSPLTRYIEGKKPFVLKEKKSITVFWFKKKKKYVMTVIINDLFQVHRQKIHLSISTSRPN